MEGTIKARVFRAIKRLRDAYFELLIVDNINGSIRVSAYTGENVEMTVHKTITARSARKINEAKKEIYLDIKEDCNTIILYVEAPYRQHDGSINHRGWRYYGYDVSFDYELLSLKPKTVPQKLTMKIVINRKA